MASLTDDEDADVPQLEDTNDVVDQTDVANEEDTLILDLNQIASTDGVEVDETTALEDGLNGLTTELDDSLLLSNKEKEFGTDNDAKFGFFDHTDPVYCVAFNPVRTNQIISGAGDETLYSYHFDSNDSQQPVQSQDSNESKQPPAAETAPNDALAATDGTDATDSTNPTNSANDANTQSVNHTESTENTDNAENSQLRKDIDASSALRKDEAPDEAKASDDANDSNNGGLLRLEADFRSKKHKDTIIDCSFSRNGKYLATASMDCTINVYSNGLNPPHDKLNKSNKLKLLHTFDGPTEEIEFIRWHPKLSCILAGSRDTTLWLYQVKTHKVKASYGKDKHQKPQKQKKNNNKNKKSGKSKGSKNKKNNNKSGNSSSSGSTASASDAGEVRLETKGKVLHVFGGHLGPVTCGDFSHCGRYAYTGSEDGTVFVWDLNGKQPKYRFKGGKGSLFHEAAVTCIDEQWVGQASGPSGVAADGKGRRGGTMITGSLDRWVILSNYELERVLARLGQHDDSVECVGFDRNNKNWALSASLDAKLKIWDVNKLGMRNECLHENGVVVAKWFPTQSYLVATGCLNGVVYVWDSRSGKPVHRFTGHKEAVQSIDISKDNSYIATGSDDGSVLVFDTRF